MSTQGIEITEINVHPLRNKHAQKQGNTPGSSTGDNPLEAFVRVVLNGQFVINSIRVVNGKFGLFISFPREYNKKEGKGYNFCFPISKALHEYMTERILNEYRLAVMG